MTKENLKSKLKKIGVTVITTLAACLVFGTNAYPVLAAAEEVPDNTITLDVTVKETQEVYSIELTQEETGEYVLVCDTDASFTYTVNKTANTTSVDCAGLLNQGEWTYEMTYVVCEDGSTTSKLSLTKGSDVVDVKITLPDEMLVEDFQNTLKIAEDVLMPKIYLIVSTLLMVALIIVAYAMLFLGT